MALLSILNRFINKKTTVLFALLLTQVYGIAQATVATAATQPVQMADGLRSNGKIYVVVAVLLTVLIGLFLYLIRLDRKISKLEKK